MLIQNPLFRAAGLAALIAMAGIIPAAAQPQPLPPSPAAAPNEPGLMASAPAAVREAMVDSLVLRDAPLQQILELLELYTQKTVVHPQALPTPTFSITINRPITQAEAVQALQTMLALNGIGVAPLGDRFLKVVPITQVRTEAPEIIMDSTLGMLPSGRVVSKIFQLQFLRVAEFVPQVQPLVNPNGGSIVPFEKANSAMVTDSLSNIQRIEMLLQRLDQPSTTGLTTRFYPLKFAKASDLVAKLKQISGPPIQTLLSTNTSINADDRTNQIIIIGDERQFTLFDDLIGKLDVASDPNTHNEVIYLKHAVAADVATLLSQLVSGRNEQRAEGAAGGVVQPAPFEGQPTPTVMAAPAGRIATTEFSSHLTILSDERTNSIIVSGTLDDIRLIQEVIEKVDILLAQVRIEVVIAEVTLKNNETTGISALGLEIKGDKLVGISGSLPGATIGKGTTTATDGSESITGLAEISRGTDVTGPWDLAGMITLAATPRKSNTRILSVPNIVTTHNKEARIFVGEQQPVISSYLNDTASSGVSSGYRSTINSRDIGIELKVKPLIGNDGSVQLEITQKVEDVSGYTEIDDNKQPIIGRRETESFISVQSGDVVVLGGLQRAQDIRNNSRLGPIPFIGDLLGTRSKEINRTDLVFFLRPVILGSSEQTKIETERTIDLSQQKEQINSSLVGRLNNPEKTPPAPTSTTNFIKSHK